MGGSREDGFLEEFDLWLFCGSGVGLGGLAKKSWGVLVIASCYWSDWVGEVRWESVKNNGSMIER
jgi:hypothetical protein